MNRATSQSGFSLIEVLVATLLFTIVVVSVSQLFVGALDLQRRATGFQKIQENSLFVLESIAREVRVSSVTSGDAGCSQAGIGGAEELVIEHPDYGTVTYRYDRSSGRGVITRAASEEGGEAKAISAGDVDFTKFAFCISGKTPGDNQQVRITIPMTVRSVSSRPSAQVSISLQTTITSRDLVEELTN